MTLKNISTVLVGMGLVLALSFAVATPASAATFTNVKFNTSNDTSVQTTGGSSVSGTVRTVVGAGEVLEQFQADLIGDSLSPVCVSVNGDKGYEEGTYEIPFTLTAQPNTSTLNTEFKGAGIYGALRAIDCNSNIVAGPTQIGQVRVVGAGSGTVGGVSQLDQLLAQIAALTAHLTCLSSGGVFNVGTSVCSPKPVDPAPTKPAYCASMPSVNSWSSSADVKVLQSWLTLYPSPSAPFMTSAQVSTGPGIYGPKTTAAHFAAQNSCR